MSALLKTLKKHWLKLAKRERLMVLAAAAATLLLLWSELSYSPNNKKAELLEQSIQQAATKMQSVQIGMKELEASLHKDPDAENKRLLSEYIEEGKRLDTLLEKASIQVISAREMTSLLEDILKKQPGMEFVSLENKPAVPEFTGDASEDDGSGSSITVYRHSVILNMEASYSSALSYLKMLEKMPWRFFWQSIEIETIKYPTARITLEVYTLGLREGLVGA